MYIHIYVCMCVYIQVWVYVYTLEFIVYFTNRFFSGHKGNSGIKIDKYSYIFRLDTFVSTEVITERAKNMIIIYISCCIKIKILL